MPLSYVSYSGNGSTKGFDVPFPYLNRSHVRVGYGFDYFANTIEQELTSPAGFTWVSNTRVQLTTAPATGTTLFILRQTPDSAQLVPWTDGSNFHPEDLNTADLQALYLVQELVDRSRWAALAGSADNANTATYANTAGLAELAAAAVRLQTPRLINGVPFDGTANINIEKGLVSVTDFGAGTTADDTAAFVAASQADGNPAILVPAGTYAFPTTPALAADSVFVFDRNATITGAGKWPTSAKRIHLGDAKSWVSTIAGGIYTYLDFNPVLNIRPSITSVGISCAQQTSEITYGFGTGSGALSFSSFIHNNNPTADTTAWPFYSTVLHDTPLGISHCMEVDIFNRSAVVEVTPHRIAKAGMTNGLWIGAGGEYTQQPTVQPEAGIASVAIAIVRNDSRPVKAACWDKGILFHSTAIRGVDGFEGTGGNGCAIGFANRHFMKWFRNADDAVIGEIGSTSNGVQPTRVTFTDVGFLISSITNNNIALQVENPATATTGIQIAPNANAGSAPLILARGAAANIDLMLSGKGTGGLGFNGGTRLKWINPGDGQLLAEVIHSGVGDMRPQLNLSNGLGFLAGSAVNGNVSLQVEIPSDATTGVQIVPNANGGPSPLIKARGNATNIDLFLAAKGTGVIGFGEGAHLRWHKASDNSALAEIGQTSTGAMRPRLSFTDSGLLASSLVNNNTAFQVEIPSDATTGVQIVPNANGGPSPLIQARGNAANIDLFLAAKGTGVIGFGEGAHLRWHKASDNSALAEIGQTSTGAMRTKLSFTDSGLLVSSLVNSNTAFQIESPSTATTGVQIAPNANGGVTPLILARGDATNVDLWLAPKGAGHLRFGTVTATPVTNNGYITIRDNAGNLVKLMTAA